MQTFIHIIVLGPMILGALFLVKIELNERQERRQEEEFNNAMGDGVENEPPTT